LTVRIYLDSTSIIYLIENVMPFATAIESRLAKPEVIRVTSDLARMECRVQPLRDGKTALLAAFDSFFSGDLVEVVPLTRQVLDRATELRAHSGFKTPDAIHLAAAIVAGCDVFLTSDKQLCQCGEITVELA
jgi:uncharacterized protein